MKEDQFETDYQLEQFREIQGEHFDSDGKKYAGVPIGAGCSEMMLKLIDQLEAEVLELRGTPHHSSESVEEAARLKLVELFNNLKSETKAAYERLGMDLEYVSGWEQGLADGFNLVVKAGASFQSLQGNASKTKQVKDDLERLIDTAVTCSCGECSYDRDVLDAIDELYASSSTSVTEGDDKMPATLLELGFIHIADNGIQGAYKTYKGFKLWVAQDPVDKNWIAEIQVKGLGIYIPLVIDAIWLYGFDKDNNGYPSLTQY